MKPDLSALKAFWSASLIAVATGLGLAKRTEAFERLAEELRGPFWRIQTPSIGPLLLRILQLASRKETACVKEVELEARQIKRPDGSKMAVYIYRPRDLKGVGAAMLYTHGGGFIFGSAVAYHSLVSAYARDLGIVIVSAEYRLAPQNPFPAPLDDIHTAYLWLVSSADELSIDSKRFVVAGESAGGGLTAALCQRIRDRGDLPPQFQLLIYPMLDDRTTLAKPDERGQLVWSRGSNRYGWSCYLGHTPGVEDLPNYAAAARLSNLSNLPATWIGVGELDLFQNESVEYGRRLLEAGVPCEIVEIPGAFHGFDIMHPKTDIARRFRARVLDAVRRL